ncbi:6058_t:CDS:2 [Ambispora leptoticha]|uniref:6058_t:CDS:1 n=1 Tax=Ambispora leptoticha TaxID=144679 RepID=A0A9N9IM60_9GLOM|nr:6058_t:CDS:2 [Ambispora leptoticha]
MALKFFETLSNNYLELLDDKEDFNVNISVGESPNTKTFQAHSAIVKYRSLYFRNKLANISKDKNNIKTLDLKHVTKQQFEIIISHNASFIFELMLIAHEFLFDELTKRLETHLIEVEAHWLRLHFTSIYQKSFQNNKLQALQKWYPENWTYENFLALKTTLQSCLPLIRYFQMSSHNILNNVQPYQQILEKNLWKDIMKRITNLNNALDQRQHQLPPY